VVILGIVAAFSLPVRLFPDTDPPVVTVITPYPGVAAVDTAKNLSKPMEEEFGGIDGVVRVTSISQMGLSVVKVEFGYKRRVEEAAVDVQNAISRIRDKLPRGIREPRVMQFSSSDKPILTIAVTSESLPLEKVRESADNPVRDRLQLVPGVAAIDVFGGHERQIEVAVRTDGLRSFGVTMDLVAKALQGWNLTESGGRVNVGAMETVVRFDAPLSSAAEVADIVLLRRGDRVVRLSDVADVSETVKEERSAYHFNGKPAIAVQVFKRDDANTLKVASAVRKALRDIERDMSLLRFEIADDDSIFTDLVINNMTSSIGLAVLLTIIVVFLFMAHLRQAAIIAISIPVSFLMTFMLMWAAEINLNMITMSAVILSIGLLVDDGIVVIENIHRHLGMPGKTPFDAAVEGTEEIFLADLAGTVTTVSVLVPLIFLGGFVGKMFAPLAWTLSFALTSSFVVSVTLIPLLGALWLRAGEERESNRLTRIVAPFTAFMETLKHGYLFVLRWALDHPWSTLGGALVVLMLSVRVMLFLGSEMLPRFDSGTFQISLDGIPGTPLDKNMPLVKAVENKLLSEPSVTGVSTQVGFEQDTHYLGGRGAMGVHQALITVNLTPRTDRSIKLWDVMDDIRSYMRTLPGVTLGTTKAKGGTARASTAAPIDVRISGPDPRILDFLGTETLARIRKVPGVRDVYKNWALDTPETLVKVNQERAVELGLTGGSVARLVYDAMEGRKVTPYRQPRYRDLDIFLRYAAKDRKGIDDLADVVIRSPSGQHVPLRELADLEQHLGPNIVTREDFRQTLDVMGYHFGRPLSETTADVQKALTDLKLPEGYRLDITGEQRDFQEARTRMIRALGLGILAVYLVLVAQFRSFKHPFTIMAAVPLQFVGVAAGLLVAGKYLSMPAMLGIILLTGTVVNNSIVLVDYILRRLDQGDELKAAITESVSVRYRPIMMTALSDVAGMLPLALEMAVGSERFSPLATAVIGGVLAATLLTLVVIPVIFLLLSGRSQRVAAARAD
jgi:HAE1 family hydrophobic/amphiphilic exporter-1